MPVEIINGDCLLVLKDLPEKSINCCVTSPPYWGLRDYGVDGQLGLESTPEEYIKNMVEVFRGVHRVLRDDGTLWLNIGDSYSGSRCGGNSKSITGKGRNETVIAKTKLRKSFRRDKQEQPNRCFRVDDCKPKDLVGIPWLLAFALRADGWFLRQDIVWSKPNPMPESVKDRCTKSHEYIFLLSKSSKYYYDNDAIREPMVYGNTKTGVGFGHGTEKKPRFKKNNSINKKDYEGRHDGVSRPPMTTKHRDYNPLGRNKRSVWEVPTQGFSEAHFATFPEKLIEPCILAGCPKGGTVIDIFGGSGTTGRVAARHNRNATLIELNPEYIELQKKRTSMVQQVLI